MPGRPRTMEIAQGSVGADPGSSEARIAIDTAQLSAAKSTGQSDQVCFGGMGTLKSLSPGRTFGDRQQSDGERDSAQCDRQEELVVHWPPRSGVAQRGHLQCHRELL